jgi:hypothetical protein
MGSPLRWGIGHQRGATGGATWQEKMTRPELDFQAQMEDTWVV